MSLLYYSNFHRFGPWKSLPVDTPVLLTYPHHFLSPSLHTDNAHWCPDVTASGPYQQVNLGIICTHIYTDIHTHTHSLTYIYLHINNHEFPISFQDHSGYSSLSLFLFLTNCILKNVHMTLCTIPSLYPLASMDLISHLCCCLFQNFM